MAGALVQGDLKGVWSRLDRRSRPYGTFRPPESVVSFEWDVFFLGLMLQAFHRIDFVSMLKDMYMDMFAEVAEQRPALHQCILSLNCACSGKAFGALEPKSVDAIREIHIQTYSKFVRF